MPQVPLSGRDRLKHTMSRLFNSSKRTTVNGELNADNLLSITDGDGFEIGAECPEHALRIYKSDQQSKYLLGKLEVQDFSGIHKFEKLFFEKSHF